jgi:hypothetical protein
MQTQVRTVVAGSHADNRNGEKTMKMISAFARVLMIAMSLGASAAYADILFNVTDSLVAGDPTQLGRLSRNGLQQDWAGSEAFPGVINPTTSYHYVTYAFNVGSTPFIQVEFDSGSLNTFVSAYQTSYLPGSGLGVHWLGDAGTSGNAFGTDPSFFNVIADLNSVLVIVINESTTNAGLGAPFHLMVEGFLDREFTSTAALIPEPSTLLLCFAALLALLGRGAWKRRSSARALTGALSA